MSTPFDQFWDEMWSEYMIPLDGDLSSFQTQQEYNVESISGCVNDNKNHTSPAACRDQPNSAHSRGVSGAESFLPNSSDWEIVDTDTGNFLVKKDMYFLNNELGESIENTIDLTSDGNIGVINDNILDSIADNSFDFAGTTDIGNKVFDPHAPSTWLDLRSLEVDQYDPFQYSLASQLGDFYQQAQHNFSSGNGHLLESAAILHSNVPLNSTLFENPRDSQNYLASENDSSIYTPGSSTENSDFEFPDADDNSLRLNPQDEHFLPIFKDEGQAQLTAVCRVERRDSVVLNNLPFDPLSQFGALPFTSFSSQPVQAPHTLFIPVVPRPTTALISTSLPKPFPILRQITWRWHAPTQWTVEEATIRGNQVFGDPALSENNLPPEAALIYMPEPPQFPPLLDPFGRPIMSPRFPKIPLRNIPWLHYPFNLKLDPWVSNLYMVFGATPDDMAERVDPHDPDAVKNTTHSNLRNRILKKTQDYRRKHGGFGHAARPIDGAGNVTQNAQAVIRGGNGGRPPITDEQLLFGVTWNIDLQTMTMRQNGENQCSVPLPQPSELQGDLRRICQVLGRPVPDMETVLPMLFHQVNASRGA